MLEQDESTHPNFFHCPFTTVVPKLWAAHYIDDQVTVCFLAWYWLICEDCSGIVHLTVREQSASCSEKNCECKKIGKKEGEKAQESPRKTFRSRVSKVALAGFKLEIIYFRLFATPLGAQTNLDHNDNSFESSTTTGNSCFFFYGHTSFIFGSCQCFYTIWLALAYLSPAESPWGPPAQQESVSLWITAEINRLRS